MDKLKSTTSRQSIRGGTQKTYASQIDKQESKSDDPRIDSPEISVVYPSITHDLPLFTDQAKWQPIFAFGTLAFTTWLCTRKTGMTLHVGLLKK